MAVRTGPVLRLGAVVGGPEEFGRNCSVVADAAGGVCVADKLAPEARQHCQSAA